MHDAETYTHKGIPVRIVWDEDARNPYTEWDNASELLYDGDYDFGVSAPPHPESVYADTPSSAIMARYLTLFGGYAVAIPWSLSDYGSGGLRVHLDTPDDDPAIGWLVMTPETVREEWDGDLEKAEACARAEFDSFRAYCEQEVFGYIVAEGTSDEDSCWGFYGDMKYVTEEANAAAEWIAEERARLRSLPWLPTFGNPIMSAV